MWFVPVLAIFMAAFAVNGEPMYKVCVPAETYSTCKVLEQGDSPVSCVKASDSANCAIKLARGEADFGFFNAEELLLAYQFYPNDIIPLFQLKHKDKMAEEFEYQMVAVVPKDISDNTNPRGGFEALRNGGLCHPGFSESQWLNDYVLKSFERRVIQAECNEKLTVAENEAENIRNFFGKACRPGDWVPDKDFDETLKLERYPELCQLCENRGNCSYVTQERHGHLGALNCLVNGNGKVAYVALSYVRDFFKTNTTYHFLCPTGKTQPLETKEPCTWIRQPWGVIAARKQSAEALYKSLKEWLQPLYSISWKTALEALVYGEGQPVPIPDGTSTASYLIKGREINLPHSQTCKKPKIRWCTIGELENNKCNWVAKASEALGIEPQINCQMSTSKFQCFRDIRDDKADIMTIDSNYGHLARTVYGLGTVLYSGTNNNKNSVVVAVVRNSDQNKIKGFDTLKGRTACFPEYGGISWLSFVYALRTSGVIKSTSCDYPKLVSNLLSGACTPGIRDTDHSPSANKNTAPISKLCSACNPDSDEDFCAATEKNRYFEDLGALRCLNETGDIAVIEMRNLKDIDIDPNRYRVLCRNGSLAEYPGFKVDDYCALSVTVDSEVVGRRNTSEIDNLDTIFALLKMEEWLGYTVHNRRPINIYQKFNGTSDLLFKDSISGLETNNSNLAAVQAYKELFDHVETCSGGPLSTVISISTIALAIFSFLINQI